MTYSIPSYIVLLGIVGLLLYVMDRTRAKKQERPGRGGSSYAIARDELSKGRYGAAAKLMYTVLEDKAEHLEGSDRGRVDVLLKKLAKASTKEENVNILSLLKEYNCTIKEI